MYPIRRLTFEKKRSVRSTGLATIMLEYDPGDLTVTSWGEAEIDQKQTVMLGAALGWLLRKHSQRELGKLLGVNHATISRWGSGSTAPDAPTAQLILSLAAQGGFKTMNGAGFGAGGVAIHAQPDAPPATPERGATREDQATLPVNNISIPGCTTLDNPAPTKKLKAKATANGSVPGVPINSPAPAKKQKSKAAAAILEPVPGKFTNCHKCPLKDRPYVAGNGPLAARTMIVGEAPGQDEAAR